MKGTNVIRCILSLQTCRYKFVVKNFLKSKISSSRSRLMISSLGLGESPRVGLKTRVGLKIKRRLIDVITEQIFTDTNGTKYSRMDQVKFVEDTS